MRSATREPWENLELVGASVTGQFRVVDAGLEIGAGPLLYAVDAGGHYHLLIPIPSHVSVHPDRRSAGVHIERRILESAGSRDAFIDVVCRKHHLREVFVHLSAEMVTEVKESPNSPEAACRRVLSRWRELLDRETAGLLSNESAAGLWGELWNLRELASRNPACLANWTGPLGAAHDFRSDAAALEVKTSLARDGRRYRIHGVDQLAPPEGAPLYFAAMKIELDESTGESLPDMIRGIIDVGFDAVDLLGRLAMVGYDTRDDEHYHRLRYRLRESRFHLVDDDFPRIIRSSFVAGALPNQVEGLTYTVDLSGDPPHPLDAGAVDGMYTALARGEE